MERSLPEPGRDFIGDFWFKNPSDESLATLFTPHPDLLSQGGKGTNLGDSRLSFSPLMGENRGEGEGVPSSRFFSLAVGQIL